MNAETAEAIASENRSLQAQIAALKSPILAREQPCGCRICYCDGDGCGNCGAKFCAKHRDASIVNDPEAVWLTPAPVTIAELRAEVARLRETIATMEGKS